MLINRIVDFISTWQLNRLRSRVQDRRWALAKAEREYKAAAARTNHH